MDKFEISNLKKIQSFIDREIASLNEDFTQSRKLIREVGKQFFLENPYGSVYGAAEELRRENENRLENAIQMKSLVEKLTEMKKAPFFGRVDFLYDGENDEQKFYIGFRTLTDDLSKEILVYDWRAPVSSLFYQGETGKASYSAPCGEINGEIRLIRQYNFHNGEIKNFWDTQLQINDSILRGVLSSPSSEKMKPIVCTIQREQNTAIRFDTKKNLAVFGPAGCGKTSVGMHRLAWLMYNMRTSGYTPSMLMFTSNEAFSSYVSSVLPELGETQLETTSFYELFETLLGDYTVERAIKQTEAVLKNEPQRLKNISLLYNEDFLDFVQDKITHLTPTFKTITILGQTVLSPEEILKRFSALPSTVCVKDRLSTLADWVKDETENYMLINRRELLNTVLHQTESGDSYTQRYRMLKERFVAKSVQMVLDSVENNPAILLKKLLNDFYPDAKTTDNIIRRINTKDLFFEDAMILLYIAVLSGNCKNKNIPSHILIDEAQDMSILQHKILRNLYPKAVFTVLGDINQGVVPSLNTTNEKMLCEIYGAETIKLNKSYRSTKQISEFAKQFLTPEQATYDTFDREGPEIQIQKCTDHIKTAAQIISGVSEEYNSVCIILKTATQAQDFCKKLKKFIPDCVALTNESQAIDSPILCMPASLIKGLEFDCVIIPNAESLENENRLMYLFTTRALHELHILQKN